MSTNAVIGKLNADNTVTAVTLHWDGYDSHAGDMLRKYFNTEELVDELLTLGEISSIGCNVDDSVFYCRDRGESLTIHEMVNEADFEDFWCGDCHYLFKDNSF